MALIMPCFSRRESSFSTFSQIAYGTVRGDEKYGFACSWMRRLALMPWIVPSSFMKSLACFASIASNAGDSLVVSAMSSCLFRRIFRSQSRPIRLGPLPLTTRRSRVSLWLPYSTKTCAEPFTSSPSPVYVTLFELLQAPWVHRNTPPSRDCGESVRDGERRLSIHSYWWWQVAVLCSASSRARHASGQRHITVSGDSRQSCTDETPIAHCAHCAVTFFARDTTT